MVKLGNIESALAKSDINKIMCMLTGLIFLDFYLRILYFYNSRSRWPRQSLRYNVSRKFQVVEAIKRFIANEP